MEQEFFADKLREDRLTSGSASAEEAVECSLAVLIRIMALRRIR